MIQCRDLTVPELKQECKRKGLKGYSGLARDALVQLCCGTAQATLERHLTQIEQQKARIKKLAATDKERCRPTPGLRVLSIHKDEEQGTSCQICGRELKNYAITSHGVMGLTCLLRQMGIPPSRNIDHLPLDRLPPEIYENYAQTVIEQINGSGPKLMEAVAKWIDDHYNPPRYYGEGIPPMKSEHPRYKTITGEYTDYEGLKYPIQQEGPFHFRYFLKWDSGWRYMNLLWNPDYRDNLLPETLNIYYPIWQKVMATKTLNRYYHDASVKADQERKK